MQTSNPEEFRDLAAMVEEQADLHPDHIAVIDGERQIDYARLNSLANRIAATLQLHGMRPQEVLALCAQSSLEYVAIFVGALRAGVTVAPLSPGATPVQIVGMLTDSKARFFFVDDETRSTLTEVESTFPDTTTLISLGAGDSSDAIEGWLFPGANLPTKVSIQPNWSFSIVYSSGTTGTPKGIVQAHNMRWDLIKNAPLAAFGEKTITMIATPLYSNTTLTAVLPTLAWGGCLVLMKKFDAQKFLQLAQDLHATHTMLVPVQYQRLMAREDFEQYDLSALQVKFCTSAPFRAELKADVLSRWPGALIEFYGMTEGGGTCILDAHLYPDKLHTVGKPAGGHDIRLIDEQGLEIPRTPGGASLSAGEVVGRSSGMMKGYHNRPDKTSEAEWFDSNGQRFIRTGDIGSFDADGFLVLLDRRKDMIISGGFNIYPSDLEAVLTEHPDVLESTVIGVPSAEWGETPVAYVVGKPGVRIDTELIKTWVNNQLGKTQRLKDIRQIDELPRNPIGKVLKRELRDRWQ